MAKGMSVHIGVESFDNTVYGSLSNTISCKKDALELRSLAQTNGFSATPLTGNVKLADVRAAVKAAAGALKSGDYFLLTFSGHGCPRFGSQPRAWCLSDAKLDRDKDKLNPNFESVVDWLGTFLEGVRVLIVANCCFGGAEDDPKDGKALVLPSDAVRRIVERDPRFAADQVRSQFDRFVVHVFQLLKPPKKPTFGAHVVEIAACGPNKVALDGESSTKMTPFGSEIHALAGTNASGGFTRFRTDLEKACKTAGIPEPFLMPFEVQSSAFDATRPYRVV